MKRRLTSKQRAFLAVIGGFIIVTGGGFMGVFSLFMLPVPEELGFKQAEFAAYMTILSVLGIISQPIVGMMLSKFAEKIRYITIGGGILGFLCCFWFSRSSSLWQFYFGAIFMSMVVPIVTIALSSSIIAHWFAAHKSVAISIVSIGISIGTVLYTQIGRIILESFGWRTTYFATGIMILVGCVIGALLVSPPPSVYGLKPFGYDETKAFSETVSVGLEFNQVLKHPGFWLFTIGCGCAGVYIIGMQQGILPMMRVDFGFSQAAAANILSLYSVMVAIAKFIIGFIYDKGGVKAAMTFITSLVTVGFLCLILFSGNKIMAIVGIVLYGIGNVFGTVVMPSFVADITSGKAYGSAFGILSIVFTFGTSIGPIMAGFSFDLTGSYRTCCIIFVLLGVINTVLTFIAYAICKKQKLPIR